MTQKVFLLSGGRTSAFMLKRMLEEQPNFRDEFIIAFGNTGKERPETLDFLHEIETRFNIDLKWLEYTRIPAIQIPAGVFPTKRRNQNLARKVERDESDHWFKLVTYETASRSGEPFDEMMRWASVCPNVRARLCSVQLKIRTIMRYVFSLGHAEYAPYIGIRKDEDQRKTEILASVDSFEHPEFPLIDWGISEPEILQFWKQNDFDLKLEGYQGNCDLCFLKAKWKRIKIARENPELVAWWKNWEETKARSTDGDGGFFRRGEPYSLIEKLAQSDMPIIPNGEKDIPCSCVEKAFKQDEFEFVLEDEPDPAPL